MPRLGRTSLDRLQGVDTRLQDLCFKAIQVYDFSVVYGLRTEAEQRLLVERGASRTMNSRHLTGHAVDLAPYPIDWNELRRFYFLAGIIHSIAHDMDMPIRWGGDWDSDKDFNDQDFNDLLHFEIPR